MEFVRDPGKRHNFQNSYLILTLPGSISQPFTKFSLYLQNSYLVLTVLSPSTRLLTILSLSFLLTNLLLSSTLSIFKTNLLSFISTANITITLSLLFLLSLELLSNLITMTITFKSSDIYSGNFEIVFVFDLSKQSIVPTIEVSLFIILSGKFANVGIREGYEKISVEVQEKM